MMESAFEAARAEAKKGAFLSLNEETVKVAIVVPILRQLGCADSHITYEKTVGQAQVKKLDIALEVEKIISIAIETKAAKESNLGKFSGLIAKQTLLAGFQFGVVTNGIVWDLYRIDSRTTTKVATLSILDHDIEEFAKFFGYENIVSDRVAAYWNSDPHLENVIIDEIIFGPELQALFHKKYAKHHRPSPGAGQYQQLCLRMLKAVMPKESDQHRQIMDERKQNRDVKVELIDAIFYRKLGRKANLRKSSPGQMTYHIGRQGVTIQVKVATAKSPGYISFNIVFKKDAADSDEKIFKAELVKIAAKLDIKSAWKPKKEASGNKRYEWLVKLQYLTDADIVACAQRFACVASDVKKLFAGA